MAHLVVFGAFALLAVAGMAALDRRSIRRLGRPTWEQLARRTSNVPFLGMLRGATIRLDIGTLWRAAVAIALYALLVVLHEILAGVPVPL